MENLSAIKEKINEMAALVVSMLEATFKGFMKHDIKILTRVLKDEDALNKTEEALTASLVNLSKGATSDTERENIARLSDIVTDLEEIGDYIKDMVERIEIKIEEKLLFSEEALDEYKHVYRVIETALYDIVNSLKLNDKNFAQRILSDEGHVDRLAQEYRQAHTERLIAGKCDPRAGNMFVDLLDFAAQISHHAISAAKSILKLK
ncbi:MAG: Na/Pi cotransporter family protein [Candidatus Omnitrophica bacterium]|nr:Na/Pi cotransporter family protein [Candidatus Omnitrophota bacterium]